MALTPEPITWKTLPKSVFSTSRAKAIWRPIPQRMMRSLMARLWAEKSQGGADNCRTHRDGAHPGGPRHDYRRLADQAEPLRSEEEVADHHQRLCRAGFFHI